MTTKTKILIIISVVCLLGCKASNVAQQSKTATLVGSLISEEIKQYGQFVGEWDCKVDNLNNDSTWMSSNASWRFEYILGGTAIQDYWINPVNENNSNERLLGTNIRTFNPKENKWECVWLENKSKKINGIWKSHQDADKNILLYDDTGKWLITFYNITENSFDWKWDFEQPDRSMKTMSKMKAKRIIHR